MFKIIIESLAIVIGSYCIYFLIMFLILFDFERDDDFE